MYTTSKPLRLATINTLVSLRIHVTKHHLDLTYTARFSPTSDCSIIPLIQSFYRRKRGSDETRFVTPGSKQLAQLHQQALLKAILLQKHHMTHWLDQLIPIVGFQQRQMVSLVKGHAL